MDGLSKDELFALMITRKPINVRDHITGQVHRGVVKKLDFEPGHEANALVTIDNKVVYHKTAG